MSDENVTIKLTPFERTVIASFLPRQSSVHIGQKILELRSELSLTDEEDKLLEVNYLPNGDIMFGNKKELHHTEEKEFIFSNQKLRIISDSLLEADKQERMPVDEKIHNLFHKITGI